MAYLDKLNADIARWQQKGLVTADLAGKLVAEAKDNHKSGIGFGQVLAILAGLLLAAAVLIMVAANWEAIPRLWRVAALFILIAAGYVGGAVLKLRGQDGFSEAAWLVGAATFGAGIALISQMYHISGDETQAILVWCVGTALAAAMLRSQSLTVAAILLAGVWGAWPFFYFGAESSLIGYPVLLAVLWGLAVWTKSIPARYLILLSLIGYCFMARIEHGAIWAFVPLTLVSAAVFIAVIVAGDKVERLTGLGQGLATVALVGTFAGLFGLQMDLSDTPHFIWISIIALAASIAALLYGGRLGRGIRWLSYLAFALQVSLIYVLMIGSMLGTAGFFLLAAIGLGLLAVFIIRMEKRLAAPAQGGQ